MRLFLEGGGFNFFDEDDYCRAERGDCHVNDDADLSNPFGLQPRVTCIAVVLTSLPSVDAARREVRSGGTPLDVGEVGSEYHLLDTYAIEFQRGWFHVHIVSWLAELGTPRELAALIDAGLNAHVTEGAVIRPSATASDGGGYAIEGPFGSRSIEDLAASIWVTAFDPNGELFAGEDGKALLAAIEQRTGCTYDRLTLVQIDLDLAHSRGFVPGSACEAAGFEAVMASRNLRESLDAGDLRGLPAEERNAILQAVFATYLANLEDDSGELLFPGLKATIPVVIKLALGGGRGVSNAQVALTRFLSLTTGLDLLRWESS